MKYFLVQKNNDPRGILQNDHSLDVLQGPLGALTSSISGNDPRGILNNNTGNKRHKKTILLHKMILEYCTDYKSLSEISEHVNRSVTHIKKHVIPELIKSGRLQRKYPDVPSHPDQQYKAI